LLLQNSKIDGFMLLKTFRYTFILLIFTISIVSCTKNDPSASSTPLRIQLTDAPTLSGDEPEHQIRELYIDIRSIEVFVVGPNAREEWIVLDFPGDEYNVLTLTNGRMRQIVEQWIPANRRIEEMRLILGNNSRIVTTTVREIPLEVPREIIVEDIGADLRLHTISSIVIDMRSALFYDKKSDTFEFKTNIRVFPEIFGWSLRGTVSPTDVFAGIMIEQDGMKLFSSTERNGTFMFLGLPGDEWTVHIFPDSLRGFRDTTFVHKIDSAQRVNDLRTITLHRIVVEAPDPDPDPEPEEEI
jgi:hypothetical protein